MLMVPFGWSYNTPLGGPMDHWYLSYGTPPGGPRVPFRVVLWYSFRWFYGTPPGGPVVPLRRVT